MSILSYDHQKPGSSSNMKMWIEESIWGHRFYDDQTPWMMFLEFMNVYLDRKGVGTALDEPLIDLAHEVFKYKLKRMGEMRFLVFNNPMLEHIKRKHDANDDLCWSEWLEITKEQTLVDFSYIRERFDKFDTFVKIAEFFRETSIEPGSNKRWTSKFLFPYGPEAIYADLDGKSKNVVEMGSMDRRFFGRGGELIYLMLNRSGLGLEVSECIDRLVLEENNPWNKLLKALMPEDYRSDVETKVGYLPKKEHKIYRQLAEDWIAIFKLKIPIGSILDSIVRITALNVIQYLLIESKSEIGELDVHPQIVLELPGGKKGAVFGLSKDSYDINRSLMGRAVTCRLDKVTESEDWKKLDSKRLPGVEALLLLKRDFHWDYSDITPSSPIDALEIIKTEAENKHKQHLGNVMPNLSRQSGLAVAKRGVGTWYSPSDGMLRTLVFTIVQKKRLEYELFLEVLYSRYGIVIGPNQAERSDGSLPIDFADLLENSERLEMRLRSLGLLQRLSDDCAYVINPYVGADNDNK